MASTTLSASVSDIPRIASAFYGTRRTAYFRGQPGCGKTDLVHQAARDIEAALRRQHIAEPEMAVFELHLASMSEVDIRGYLIPTDSGEAKFTRPAFASFVDQHKRGILFLDEFPQATHEVQKAVAPLLLDGRIGEYQLPPSWMVIAAGNREEDNSGVNNLLGHVVNRLSIMDVRPPDVDDWLLWAAEHDIQPQIMAFAKINPQVVFGTPDLTANDKPYCTPRSLAALAAVAHNWPGNIDGLVADRAGLVVAQGFIGEGAMAELRGVLTMAAKLPTYDEIVKDPTKAKVPTSPNEQYAAVMMVAMRAKVEHGNEVVQYLTRFQPNMGVVGMAALVKRDTRMTQVAAMGQWLRENRSVVQKLTQYINPLNN